MRIAIALTLSLCGCGDAPEPTLPPRTQAVQSDPDAYAMLLPRGGPGEPAKGAIIGGEWIFDTPTGAGWFAAPLPTPESGGRERAYRFREMQLRIEPGACADPRLRDTLPDRISVEYEHATYPGCGGPRQRVAGVAGTYWQVLRLGREAAPKDASPTMFLFGKEGRVGGTLACNDVGIRTRWTEGRFLQSADQSIEGTAVGCNGPDVEFGQRFWAAMYRAVSWTRSGDRVRILLSDGSDADLRLIL